MILIKNSNKERSFVYDGHCHKIIIIIILLIMIIIIMNIDIVNLHVEPPIQFSAFNNFGRFFSFGQSCSGSTNQ